MATVGPTGTQLPVNPLGAALGVQFETFPAAVMNNQATPANQSAYGGAVYGTTGSTITGVKMRNGVAAAGTAPTTARFGLADLTGKILVLSGNVNNATNWPAGVCTFPFTAPFALTYNGAYFPCFVINGAWGTTQPSLNENGSANGAAFQADGSNPPVTFVQTGQTDLPAIGSSLTITTGSTRNWYLALY